MLSREQQDANDRADRRARLLTPGFSVVRHLVAFGTLSVAALGLALWLARSARLADLWIVPAYLLAANVSEYLIHRLLMHRPLGRATLYRNHTLGHHRAFHHDSMEIASWRELDLVMMPWFSLLLFFAGMAPLVAAIAWALGRGAAGLLLLTARDVLHHVRGDARALSPSAAAAATDAPVRTAASSASSTTTTGSITG